MNHKAQNTAINHLSFSCITNSFDKVLHCCSCQSFENHPPQQWQMNHQAQNTAMNHFSFRYTTANIDKVLHCCSSQLHQSASSQLFLETRQHWIWLCFEKHPPLHWHKHHKANNTGKNHFSSSYDTTNFDKVLCHGWSTPVILNGITTAVSRRQKQTRHWLCWLYFEKHPPLQWQKNHKAHNAAMCNESF